MSTKAQKKRCQYTLCRKFILGDGVAEPNTGWLFCSERCLETASLRTNMIIAPLYESGDAVTSCRPKLAMHLASSR